MSNVNGCINGFLAVSVRAGLLLSFGLPAMAAESSRPPHVAVAEHGMVASDSPYASQAGCEILKAGGNAVDAAIATSLALSVTRPFSSGLGGGGFMMVRLAETGEVHLLDYRECAPGAATADMYVKAGAAAPDGPPPSRFGGLAAGVPGLLAGHKAMHERLGTRPLRELIEPARRLAADGFTMDGSYIRAAGSARNHLQRYPSMRAWTGPLEKRFGVARTDLRTGMLVHQPELAATLELIATEGIDVFYRGAVAESIVEAVQATGGIMTRDDLAGYKAVWREPIRTTYRDRFEVLLMPPPSSGGVVIAEMLNILERWNLSAIRKRDPGLAAHYTVEAMKHAMADRARYLGDADFAAVPVDKLVSKEHANALAARIQPDRVSEPDRYGWVPRDDAGTTHYCVVDRWGNVVSATETINTEWGCLLMVESRGIVLNDEMDDFSVEPDKPNAFNLAQSQANAVGPFKRPLSSMSPTIIVADGKPVLAVGASGGPRIITATLQAILNVLDYDMPLGQALSGPRLHHQWSPDEVHRNDYPADDPVVVGLAARGHVISERSRGAVVQAIRIEPGRLTGASDPRKGGIPAGY
jgi:gamma-glutamyltranspeptidase / glutathione hydrolase